MQPSNVSWYQHVLFLSQQHRTSLPYGQANKLNQQSLDFCIFFQKKNLFTIHTRTLILIFFWLPQCENLPHKNTGRECLASSLWGPSNYTTKIPLALQCTIPPLGCVNQHPPFSFCAIHFYHFAFIGVCYHGYVTYQLFLIVALTLLFGICI